MFALKEKTHPVDYEPDGAREILDLDLNQAIPSAGTTPSSLRTALRRLSPSIIAEDVALEGNVSAKGEIQLDGEVHGDVHCAALEIGPNGLVVGRVMAADIAIAGRVRGPIQGEHVLLRQTADVEGDIAHTSLCIEKGARYEGRSLRNRPPVDVARPAPARGEYLPGPGQVGAESAGQERVLPAPGQDAEAYDGGHRNGIAPPPEHRRRPDAA